MSSAPDPEAPTPDPEAPAASPDAAVSAPVGPAHLDPRLLAAVAFGGAGGTWVRAQLFALAPPPPDGWPWVTFAVNVTGSFLLGLLLHTLALRGPDAGRRRLARLGLGTGVLGGYTTYSTFAVESATLAGDGHLGIALAYDGASVLAGVLAAATGFLLAQRTAGGGGRP